MQLMINKSLLIHHSIVENMLVIGILSIDMTTWKSYNNLSKEIIPMMLYIPTHPFRMVNF